MDSTEIYCARCKEMRAVAHTCYGETKEKPRLDVQSDPSGPVYSYDRTKYRIERVKEQGSEEREVFRVVEK
jgi:hypothetical protein